MHLSLIAPTSMLQTICGEQSVQFCIVHRTLNDPEYAAFYASEARKTDTIVIMDNGLWELGSSMSFEALMEASRNILPDELIAPDVLYDMPKTLHATSEFLTQLECFKRSIRESSPKPVPFLEFANFAVPQGKNRKDWLYCFDHFNNNPLIRTIGIPKILNKSWKPGGRLGCMSFLEHTNRIHSDKQYHALGVHDPTEFLQLSKFDWLRSVDTALPVHIGMSEIAFCFENGLIGQSRPRRPEGFFDAKLPLSAVATSCILFNVFIARNWSKGIVPQPISINGVVV